MKRVMEQRMAHFRPLKITKHLPNPDADFHGLPKCLPPTGRPADLEPPSAVFPARLPPFRPRQGLTKAVDFRGFGGAKFARFHDAFGGRPFTYDRVFRPLATT